MIDGFSQGIDEYLKLEIPRSLQKLQAEGLFQMTSMEYNLLQQRLDKLEKEGVNIDVESEESDDSVSREEANDIMHELEDDKEYFVKHPSTQDLMKRRDSISQLSNTTKASV